MKPDALLQALLELADEAGLRVELAQGDEAVQSGACRVGDRIWVILDARDPVAHRVEALAGALRQHGAARLAGRWLPPAVRECLELSEW